MEDPVQLKINLLQDEVNEKLQTSKQPLKFEVHVRVLVFCTRASIPSNVQITEFTRPDARKQ